MYKIGSSNVVENASELEGLGTRSKKLWLDVETTSFHDDIPAVNPFMGGAICGVALTFDDCSEAFYVPVRHRDPKAKNVDIEAYQKWLKDLLGDEDRLFSNFNIKFDAHFCQREEGVQVKTKLLDSKVESRLLDSDAMKLGLKYLMEKKLGMSTSGDKRVKQYLKSRKSKDYGILPVDLTAEYAGDDVFAARALDAYNDRHFPEDMAYIRELERDITPILFRMEETGIKVDWDLVEEDYLNSRSEKARLEGEIFKACGQEFRDSTQFYSWLFLDYCGLKPISWNKPTKTGKINPCFDKNALRAYELSKEVQSKPKILALVKLVRAVKKVSQYLSLYLRPFLMLAQGSTDGKIHCDFNQVVRTGRMSCGTPNLQQANADSARLFVPEEGHYFLCSDASQCEFRIIAHIIQNERVIKAYNSDKKVDYHALTAELAGGRRDEAKTINFGLAFGEGQKKLMAQVAASETTRSTIMQEQGLGEEDMEEVVRLCHVRARKVFTEYHRQMPELLQASSAAQYKCGERGYARTLYGRRRDIRNKDFQYRAFNTTVQGTAGDYVKERMRLTSDVTNESLRKLGVRLLLQKHDELLWQVPNRVPPQELKVAMKDLLEKEGHKKFRVPMVWDVGHSSESWLAAKKATEE